MARVAVAADASLRRGWPSLRTSGYHNCRTHSHSRTFARAPQSSRKGTAVAAASGGAGGGINEPVSHQRLVGARTAAAHTRGIDRQCTRMHHPPLVRPPVAVARHSDWDRKSILSMPFRCSLPSCPPFPHIASLHLRRRCCCPPTCTGERGWRGGTQRWRWG